MSSKITIIGAGSVGSTIAYTLSNEDIASEIVLIDINKKKVEGEVMDIAQGTCFRDPVSIIAGEYEDAKDSDIVIITSGIARKPGQTRIELTQTNVNILKSITPEIVKAAPNAIYIIVSNPVDCRYRTCNPWTERKKRCSGQTVRRSAHHKRWCYDCKRDRAGRRL